MVLTVQQRNVCAAAIAKAKQQLGQLEEQQARADRAAQRAAQREAQRAQQAEAAVKREAKIAAWRPKVGQRVVVPKLNAMGKVCGGWWDTVVEYECIISQHIQRRSPRYKVESSRCRLVCSRWSFRGTRWSPHSEFSDQHTSYFFPHDFPINAHRSSTIAIS